jgi:hypothetical protein
VWRTHSCVPCRDSSRHRPVRWQERRRVLAGGSGLTLSDTRSSDSTISPIALRWGTMKTPGFDLPATRRSRKCRVIVRRSCVIVIRPCSAAISSRIGSAVPRRPTLLTSRMSIAGSRDRRPAMISESRSSSARKRLSRSFRRDLPASRLQARKEVGIRLAQRNCGPFKFPLAFCDVIVDCSFILEIVCDHTIAWDSLRVGNDSTILSGDAPC